MNHPYTLLTLFLSGFLFQGLQAQEDKYTLLTEPFNQRPVAMHKGQLQFNAGYRLAARTGLYDNAGEKIDLKEDGTAVAGHGYFFDLRFGILEFLEVAAEMNYLKQGIRGLTREYISNNDWLTVTELTEYKGFEDFLLSATLRLPFLPDFADLGFTGFCSFPTAKHKPPRPGHTIEHTDPLQNWTTISYRHYEKNGSGTLFYGAGGTAKIRAGHFAAMFSGLYMTPAGETESTRWDADLTGSTFTYTESTYSLKPPAELDINAAAHYQAAGWLNLFLGGEYYRTIGGWFEKYSQKYACPEMSLTALSAGFEIQVSPRLRLLEYARFPVGGRNTYSSFIIHTGLSYNLIF